MNTATFRLHLPLPKDPTAAHERRAVLGQAVTAFEALLSAAAPEDASMLATELARVTYPTAEDRPERHWIREQVAAEGGYDAPAAVAAGLARNLQRASEQRAHLLADCLTAPQVAELLGVSRQTPHDRRQSKRLLAAYDRGVWRFPPWQFDLTAAEGVLPGLPEVLQELAGMDDLSQIDWLTTVRPGLANRSVVDLLRAGERQLALDLARAAAVR